MHLKYAHLKDTWDRQLPAAIPGWSRIAPLTLPGLHKFWVASTDVPGQGSEKPRQECGRVRCLQENWSKMLVPDNVKWTIPSPILGSVNRKMSKSALPQISSLFTKLAAGIFFSFLCVALVSLMGLWFPELRLHVQSHLLST